MRIGEFAARVGTTKDTIRHYEDLTLIQPQWLNRYKHYSVKDELDFHAIQEMKSVGMTLGDIQLVFELKRQTGCGTAELLCAAHTRLASHLNFLQKEEEALRSRRLKLERILEDIKHAEKAATLRSKP